MNDDFLIQIIANVESNTRKCEQLKKDAVIQGIIKELRGKSDSLLGCHGISDGHLPEDTLLSENLCRALEHIHSENSCIESIHAAKQTSLSSDLPGDTQSIEGDIVDIGIWRTISNSHSYQHKTTTNITIPRDPRALVTTSRDIQRKLYLTGIGQECFSTFRKSNGLASLRQGNPNELGNLDLELANGRHPYTGNSVCAPLRSNAKLYGELTLQSSKALREEWNRLRSSITDH